MESLRAGMCLSGIAFVVGATAACSTSDPPRPFDGDPAALRTYYREAAGVEPITVSSPRVLDHGPAIRAEMLRLARSAEDHILVGSFLLNDGPESREVLDTLAERAAAGVRVRVIGDTSSRYVMEREAFSYLASRGVPAAEFNPVRAWQLLYLPALLERDHRKFWVVDGRHVFLGGANLSDSSLAAPDRGGNLDFMIRFESPEAAAALTESFVETWNRSKAPTAMEAKAFAGKARRAGEGRGNFWIFDQTDVRARPSQTEILLNGLYAAAQRSIWLLEPYTFTHPEILEDIRSLAGRGVEVNLVLSSKVRAPRFRYASFYGVRDLIEAGARVWIYESEVVPLHYKGALVDDRLAFIGSSNLNLRSFRLSHELNVVFDDPETVAEVRSVIATVREGSREIDLEEARGYRSPRFATWWLIMQVAG